MAKCKALTGSAVKGLTPRLLADWHGVFDGVSNARCRCVCEMGGYVSIHGFIMTVTDYTVRRDC